MAFELDIGFVSLTGRKAVNEDFCAAMLPPAGSDCIRRPRTAIRRSASSRLSTPATQAATHSPTEWPITAAGSMPKAARTSLSRPSLW